MPDVIIADALKGKVAVDSNVTAKGWVRTRRDSKGGFSFVAVNDGSCFDSIQALCPNTLGNFADEVARLTAGCAVEITGKLVKSQGKGQAFEIQADAVKVVGWVEDPVTYPVQPKQHTMEYLREVAHLRPRTNTFGAVTRVRNTLASAVNRFFQERGFFWIHTPIITTSDAEGAGAMFRVSTLDLANLPRTPEGQVDFSKDFFGKPASLTVSGQLNVETYCMAMSRVYTFGPTFRAENSNTTRHLAEDFLKYIFRAVLDERQDDMKFFVERIDKEAVSRVEKFVGSSFERMDYSDAIKALEKSGRRFEFPVKWGMDMQSEHERWLTEEHVGRPVVVMNYPKEIKAFYMRLNDDGRTVAAMDVLAPGIGEIIGGSQREERFDVLDARMAAAGMDVEHYAWYRDLRRYGTVPHAGFGLGFERTIAYVTGLSNVRDVIPFPRSPGNARY
jgi:asparaginyl-tRNA synthetase